MKRNLFISAGLILFSALVLFLFPGLILSPGELHQSHAQIENCSSCHTPFSKPTSESCMGSGCHDTASWNRYKSISKSHTKTTECMNCHTEHKGVNGIISTNTAHTNVTTASNCDDCHKLTTTHSRVTTDQKKCQSCHGIDAWRPAKFDHRGVKQGDNCAKCHKLPQKHFKANGNCGDCHAVNKWKPAKFAHRFPMDHKSRRVQTCKTCHPKSLKTYDCYSGCHKHTFINVRAEHFEEGIFRISDCMSCHPTGREHERRRSGGNNNYRRGYGDGDDDDDDDDDDD